MYHDYDDTFDDDPEPAPIQRARSRGLDRRAEQVDLIARTLHIDRADIEGALVDDPTGPVIVRLYEPGDVVPVTRSSGEVAFHRPSRILYVPRKTDTKETPMKKSEIRSQINELRTQLTHLERQLTRPAEPNTGLIIFRKRYSAGGVIYGYAALKSGSKWFTTGSTCPPRGFTWDDLLDFIEKDNTLPPVYEIATPTLGVVKL